MLSRPSASTALISALLLVQLVLGFPADSAVKRVDAPSGKYSIQKSPLDTPWTDKVDTSNPWPDYPRPQLQRSEWKNLNGIWMWQDALDKESYIPAGYTFKREVLVPSCLESGLSGEFAKVVCPSWLLC